MKQLNVMIIEENNIVSLCKSGSEKDFIIPA